MSDNSDDTPIGDLLDSMDEARRHELLVYIEHIREQLSTAAERLDDLDSDVSSEPDAMTVSELAEICQTFRHLSSVLSGYREIGSEALDTMRMLWMRRYGMDAEMRDGDTRGGADLFDMIPPPDDIGPPDDPTGQGSSGES
jgi:hypothetical protein